MPCQVAPIEDGNDAPTFVLEEGSASRTAARSASTSSRAGTAARDAVGGTLELIVRTLAFGRAAKSSTPAASPRTRELLAWNAGRDLRLYAPGSKRVLRRPRARGVPRRAGRGARRRPLRNVARRLFGATYCVKALGVAGAEE